MVWGGVVWGGVVGWGGVVVCGGVVWCGMVRCRCMERKGARWYGVVRLHTREKGPFAALRTRSHSNTSLSLSFAYGEAREYSRRSFVRWPVSTVAFTRLSGVGSAYMEEWYGVG